MKLNNKGFTLIEILAVVIILSIITAIMVPSVNYLIDKNKEDNYKQLEKNILNATKIYLSDNRYNINLDYGISLCEDREVEENIASINENTFNEDWIEIYKMPITREKLKDYITEYHSIDGYKNFLWDIEKKSDLVLIHRKK